MANFVRVERIRFDVYDTTIGGFTRTAGGMVTRWNIEMTNRIKDLAKTATGATTTKYGWGILANSFSVVLVGTGESRCEVHLKNSQPYAEYVFWGTEPLISAGGQLMPVGKSQFRGVGKGRVPNGWESSHGEVKFRGITPRYVVPGQKANNQPKWAMETILRKRGILHS